MILTEFILMAITAVFVILTIFSGILYNILRNSENLIRTIGSIALAIAFIAAALYHGIIINNLFIYETVGTFPVDNPAEWLPFIAAESIAFRGAPAILFSTFKSIALPSVYAPGTTQFYLLVVTKLFLSVGAIAFAYLAELTVLAERFGRGRVFTSLVAALSIVGFLVGVYAAMQVDGPLTAQEAARIALLNNISVALQFIPLIAALGLLAFGLHRLHKETGERGYMIQAIGIALITIVIIIIMIISLSPFSLLAKSAVANEVFRRLIGLSLIATSAVALIGATLIIAGTILEILPTGGEEG